MFDCATLVFKKLLVNLLHFNLTNIAVFQKPCKQSNIVIKQYCCAKKRLKINYLAELMLLFKTSLSRLISKLSLISRTILLTQFSKMVNSSKVWILLEFSRWS